MKVKPMRRLLMMLARWMNHDRARSSFHTDRPVYNPPAPASTEESTAPVRL